MSSNSIWDKLQTVDRRVFYWVLFITLMIPYLRPIGFPIAINPPPKGIYDELSMVQPGDVILLSINSGVSAWGDCLPAMVACIRMLADQGAHIVVWGMGHTDIDITWQEVMDRSPELDDYVYGDDYAYFGYLPTQETTIALLADDIRAVFSLDRYGNPIDDLKIMEDINGAKDFRLMLSSDTGDVQGYYIRQWGTRHGTPIGSIGIAMNASGDLPFFLSGDLFGLSGGSRGGAELEQLTGKPGQAITTMDAISVSHLLVVFAIILANVGYFATRGKR
jgi:hypothetical protein